MSGSDLQPGEEGAPVPPTTAWTRLGVILMGLSLVLWLPLPVLPFLSMSAANKAALGGGLVVSAEVAFWLGAALAGPEAARRMRSWFRRDRDEPSEPA